MTGPCLVTHATMGNVCAIFGTDPKAERIDDGSWRWVASVDTGRGVLELATAPETMREDRT